MPAQLKQRVPIGVRELIRRVNANPDYPVTPEEQQRIDEFHERERLRIRQRRETERSRSRSRENRLSGVSRSRSRSRETQASPGSAAGEPMPVLPNPDWDQLRIPQSAENDNGTSESEESERADAILNADVTDAEMQDWFAAVQLVVPVQPAEQLAELPTEPFQLYSSQPLDLSKELGVVQSSPDIGGLVLDSYEDDEGNEFHDVEIVPARAGTEMVHGPGANEPAAPAPPGEAQEDSIIRTESDLLYLFPHQGEQRMTSLAISEARTYSFPKV